QLDLLFRPEIVTRRIVEIEIGHLRGELRRLGQPAQLVWARNAGQRHRFLDEPPHRVEGEVGGRGGRHRAADEDAEREVLLARVLDRRDLAEPDLGRERLVFHGEGVGRGGATPRGPAQYVVQEIDQERDPAGRSPLAVTAGMADWSGGRATPSTDERSPQAVTAGMADWSGGRATPSIDERSPQAVTSGMADWSGGRATPSTDERSPQAVTSIRWL